ncbi:sigma-70 family RNA polymerase sigma factor [Bradyrhizobium sp. Leo170]|uniref:RNA polymerase sigma factor n=1 Tax=Bradyrhizobium sp. Leo170 TaxID=1571199 RepID=UPI00102ECC7A|nr:sigma-70 family RNA polymerase sigma factor [Bradyrhizobium sp. Leo170]TAI67960.1 RNA polymerase subunit sigma-70 [Bradyrhizobium sp. Leo170]
MTQSSLGLVRQFLLDRYDDLKYRLTVRLGSSDLAGDALQDAWLNLQRANALGAIRDPGNYIFGVAMNAARDRMRDANNRLLSAAEVEGLLQIVDDAPDPAQTVEAQSDWQVLISILQEMPRRRREILLMARLDEMPRAEIARRLGISQRLVEKELQLAQEYCIARRRQRSKIRVRLEPLKNVLSLKGNDLGTESGDRALPDEGKQRR